MIFFDTESEGLVGPTSTIQWKQDDGPTIIHLVWDEPARNTLRLIERLVEDTVVGFNLTGDWFHVQRLYCILRLLDPDRPPTTSGWLAVQREATNGPCVKPKSALDLMLHMMAGPLQSTMDRKDIRIRKVPTVLAQWLADELKRLIPMPGIYFHYRQNGYEWKVEPIEDKPGFSDIVLRWGASRGLKPIGQHVMGLEVLEYDLPSEFMPKEDLYNPFGTGWLTHHEYHCAYWRLDERARRYAEEDVAKLTYGLWVHAGRPQGGDTNSILACLVGSQRWRGFGLDLSKLREIRDAADAAMQAFPRAPKPVLYGLRQRCKPEEAIAITDTCAETLAEIAGTREGDVWRGGWGDDHPAAQFARGVTIARSKEKEKDMAEKLLSVGSFHPDVKVIGALSGRMSGAGGINAHGIPSAAKGSHMREAFILCHGAQWLSPEEWAGEFLKADRDDCLDAGDFDSFEVAIAAGVYDDPNLTADLKSGKKIHAIYAQIMLEIEYDVARNTKSIYLDGKRGFLARLYGAQDPKIATVFNITMDQVQRNEAKLAGRYPGIGRARQETADRFCSMKQVGGIGSPITWRDPADYEEGVFGDRRYFTLENRIAKALFELSQSQPAIFREFEGFIERTKNRRQTIGGAAQSAIYACAFNIQASAMRQAANHRIQSTGARITKELQRALWDHQPCGIHPWVVQPMQIHDEIQCPRKPGLDLRPTVNRVVEHYQQRIPLLKMEWLRDLNSWADKG